MTTASRPTRRCWFGPRRRGRCRAINSRRCIRILSTRRVPRRRTWRQADRRIGTCRRRSQQKSKRELTVVDRRLSGTELVGRRYLPPFDYYYKDARATTTGDARSGGGSEHVAWRVVAGRLCHDRQWHWRRASGARLRRSRLRSPPRSNKRDFVDGDGPHADLRRRARRQIHGRSAPNTKAAGSKTRQGHRPRSQAIAACSYHQEQYLHEYPFCWRAEEDPLIQYPRQSWFIRTIAVQRRDAREQRARSTGSPSTSRRAASAISSRPTSTGPSAANATGARRCRSGFARRRARWKPSAATTSCWPSPASRGTEVWDEAKKRNPELPDDLQVHKPYIDEIIYDSPFAKGARHAPRARSHRLLVRRRRDAVRPVGLSAHSRQRPTFQIPISGRLHQRSASTRPAAGSTANWRSAR